MEKSLRLASPCSGNTRSFPFDRIPATRQSSVQVKTIQVFNETKQDIYVLIIEIGNYTHVEDVWYDMFQQQFIDIRIATIADKKKLDMTYENANREYFVSHACMKISSLVFFNFILKLHHYRQGCKTFEKIRKLFLDQEISNADGLVNKNL